MDGLLHQAIRCPSTHREVQVQAQRGTTPDGPFVLWSDVQSAFPSAESIRIGDFAVPFMKDENHNLIKPRRIAHHPDIVLELVTVGGTRSGSTNGAIDTIGVKSSSRGIGHHDNDLYRQSRTEITLDIGPMTCNNVALAVVHNDNNSQDLVNYSKELSDDSRPSLDSKLLHSACMQTTVPGHRIPAADIMQSLDQLQIDVAKNGMIQTQWMQHLLEQQQQTRKDLLEKSQQMEQLLTQERELTLGLREEIRHLHQLQQSAEHQLLKKQDEIQILQQSAQDELLKKQEEILDLQKQTLNRLAAIQSHVRALLTQTYELHEYPVPRLFIVLPKSARLRDRFTNLFVEQFRLYFLCECGTHTVPDGSKAQHEVHLAKHDGYDLERPNEFFEKFGSYILAMMYMIKCGITAGSIVVPPLANFKILERIEDGQKHMEYLKKNIAPLVDDTISFLKDFKRSGVTGEELSSDHAEFEKLEALEGPDLRHLESYLKVEDKGRVLGNLYRIATPEGHVKWVCLDHYHANYRESEMMQLRKAVESHGGVFNEDTGIIDIKISTRPLARDFYEAMAKARRTYELEITLKWDVTLDDLRELRDAVNKANVIRLTINGESFKGPTTDFINRARRFDPIIQIPSNARVQSLRLVGFEDFFSRVTKYTFPSPKLRVFSIEWKDSLNSESIKFFNDFLEHCSGLKKLELKFHHQYLTKYPTMKDLMDYFQKIHKLESLGVDYGNFLLTASFRECKIQDTSIMIPELDSINDVDLKFIQEARFNWLVLGSIPQNGDKLARILRHSRPTITSNCGMKLQDLMDLVTSSAPESFSVGFQRLTMTADISQGKAQGIAMEIEQLDDLTSDDLTFIRKGQLVHLAINSAPLYKDEDRLADILLHNPTLVRVQIRHRNRSSSPVLPLQKLLSLVPSETLTELESLTVEYTDTLIIACFSQGRIQDVTVDIQSLGKISPGFVKFIQGSHLTKLSIKHTQEADEDQLVTMLSQYPSLSCLKVGCNGNRSLAIINLVVSTRKRIIEQGCLFSLRVFEVMDEGLTPFDELGSRDDNIHIQSHLVFPDGSDTFDMRTWIRLQEWMFEQDASLVRSFVRRYGWSVVFFDGFIMNGNAFSSILNQMSDTRTFQLERLIIHSGDFSEDRIDHLENMILQSPNFKDLGLYVGNRPLEIVPLERALSLLPRYGTTLSKLQLFGDNPEVFSIVASSFPTRHSFRALESFELSPQSGCRLPSDFSSWIMAIVSAPFQGSISEYTQQDTVAGQITHRGPKLAGSYRSLKKVMFRQVQLQPEEWTGVIETMDPSALKHLDLRETNIVDEHYELLVGRFPRIKSPPPIEAFAFALAGSKLYVHGGKTVVNNVVNNTSDQLYALDLSLPWNVNQAPWQTLAKGIASSLINGVASPDNKTFYAFFLGVNNSMIVPAYDIPSGTWGRNPMVLTPDQDHRQGIRPVIDPNTSLIYVNAYQKLDVIDPKTTLVNTYAMPPNTFTSKLFSGATFVKSRNSIMYYGGLNGTVKFDPEATYVTEYSIATRTWSKFIASGQPPGLRADFCMASSEDGNTVIVFGGRIPRNETHVPPTDFTGTLYILDVLAATWIQGPDGDIRSYMACVIIGGQFIAWGGSDGTSSLGGPPVIFNLKSQQWINNYIPPAYMQSGSSPLPGSSPSTRPSISPSGAAPSSSFSDSSSSSSSSNLGAILGGVFGCLFVVALAGLIYLRMIRNEDRLRYGSSTTKQQPEEKPSENNPSNAQPTKEQMASSYFRDPQDGQVVFTSPIDSEMQYTVSLKSREASPFSSGDPQPHPPVIFTPTTMYPTTAGTGAPVPPTTVPYLPSRENYMTELNGTPPMAYSGPPHTAATMNVGPLYGTQPFQTHSANPAFTGATTIATMASPNTMDTTPFGTRPGAPSNLTSEPIATTVNNAYRHPAVHSVVMPAVTEQGLVYMPPVPPRPPVPPLPQGIAAPSSALTSESSMGYGDVMTPSSTAAATAATPMTTNDSILASSEGSQASPSIPPIPQRPTNTGVHYSSVIPGPKTSIDLDD
ncbi:hypothetical protein BGX34_011742 [Mortierella sp. NVP85]|nr:hypothetical protein BGX34_011742 [Mortierella sp. NVP85]